MPLRLPLILVVALLSLGLGSSASGRPTVSVAAAANLVHALEALNVEFRRTAPDVILTATSGASGSLFAQIKNGAPFDVFLSADTDYPQQVVAAGLAEAASLRTFATGRLAIWTTRNGLDVTDIAAAATAPTTKKIALAQPRTAPYGRAAEAVLKKLGVWDVAAPKLVLGESIAQTAQFVEKGSADLGFVALSLLRSPALQGVGRWKEIPAALHAGIALDHAGVLTRRGAANPAARRYLEFLGSEAAKKILRDFGYGVP